MRQSVGERSGGGLVSKKTQKKGSRRDIPASRRWLVLPQTGRWCDVTLVVSSICVVSSLYWRGTAMRRGNK